MELTIQIMEQSESIQQSQGALFAATVSMNEFYPRR